MPVLVRLSHCMGCADRPPESSSPGRGLRPGELPVMLRQCFLHCAHQVFDVEWLGEIVVGIQALCFALDVW